MSTMRLFIVSLHLVKIIFFKFCLLIVAFVLSVLLGLCYTFESIVDFFAFNFSTSVIITYVAGRFERNLIFYNCV